MASQSVTLSRRVLANRANGQRGGLATALKHGPEFCQARATKAGLTVKARYGTDYYRHIRKLVKNRPRVVKHRPKVCTPVPVPPVRTTQPEISSLNKLFSE